MNDHTPKPNEVWETNDGQLILVVYDATKVGRTGFIWFDPSYNNITFTPVQIAVKKSSVTVAEWGLMVNELIKK